MHNLTRRRWLWFLLGMVASVALMSCCLTGMALTWLSASRGEVMGVGEAVAVIHLEGTIVSGEPPASLAGRSQSYSAEIVRLIEQAATNTAIRALVLRVDSPGGDVVASDEVYQALLRVEKPVVVSMGSLAASGGYFISCGADEIFANANTLTGSIGVIGLVPNLEGLLEKIGVSMYVLESGPHKESGRFQPFTEVQREVWNRIISEAHESFVQVVVEGRGIPEDRVRELADGRVYTGQQALEAGLVDTLGNLGEATARAGALGGIVGKPRTIHYRSIPSLFEGLLGSLPSARQLPWQELLGQPLTAQYLYLGP